MSIKLMSAIFDTEFRDLQDAEGNTTKASTAKFVAIALADHANDEGEGAYPSLDTIANKTSLSRQCVINALDALKYNGIAMVVGESKWGTKNYTINKMAFPKLEKGSQPRLLVNPVDPPQSTGITPPVNPVDPNHPLTVLKTNGDKSPLNIEELPIEWQIAGNVEKIVMPDNTQALRRDAANLIAMTFGSQSPQAFDLVMAFQNERGITFTESDIKGQRKAVRALLEKNVKPNHVSEAVRKLLAGKMTISDLFGIVKTAVDLSLVPVFVEARAEYQPFPFVGDK